MKKKFVVTAVAAVFIAASAVSVWACSVPVFRYALERWQADPYEVVIFHRGEMTTEQQAAADQLSSHGRAGKIHANLRLTLVDLAADPDPKLVKLWEEQKTETLPWLAVRYPEATRIPIEAFAGPLTEKHVDLLLDSPSRREIARRLLTGDTAVWVLLESGDKEKDDAAFKLVEKEAKRLATVLKLPEIDAADLDEVSVDPAALKLQFSTVRLSRKNPQEKMFVAMLLGSEQDLHETDEPMAFPVFGRGRVLYAIMGGGITAENIEQAGVDLTGPCTCTVKDQNPGVDLVMAVDWDGLVERQVDIDKELPPLAGLGAFSPDVEEESSGNVEVPVKVSAKAKEIEANLAEPTTEQTENPLLRNMLLISGFAIAVVIAGSLVLFRKQS